MKLRLPFQGKSKAEQTSPATGLDGATVPISVPTGARPDSAGARASRGRRRKRRAPVRALIALAVVIAVGVGIYVWQFAPVNSAQAGTPSLDVPVTKGDLSVAVESSGKIAATSETEVAYEAQGEVVEVPVKEGDHVSAGQVLLRQTDQTQKLAVQEAQAALDTAQAKLNDLKAGSSEAEISSAQADLVSAQAALQKVKAGATSREIADAEADLRAAQANLQTVKAPSTPQEIASAQADLQAAQANLETVKAGSTTKEKTDAQADLDAAVAKLAEVQKPASGSEVASAESDLEAARAKLAALKSKPTAAELSTAQLNVANAEASRKSIQDKAALDKKTKQLALDKADRELQQAQRDWVSTLNKADSQGNSIVDEQHNFVVPPDDRNYDALYKAYWDAYNALKDAEANQTQAYNTLQSVLQQEAGDVAAAQAKIDDARKQLQEVAAGATATELTEAQANVDKAQKTLDELKQGPASDTLAAAQSAVTKARAQLAELEAGPTADELATAQAKVFQAQSKLDELKAGPAADKLAEAQSQVDKARNKLNELKAGPSRADISEAEAKLAQKQAALDKLLKPSSTSDIAAAQEAVVKAEKSLADSRAELDKTVLHAPFSGIVGEVDAEPNAIVSVGKTALTLYSPDGMHLDLDVSEGDIEKVKVGQEASITIDAIEGKTITGTVTSISPVATSGQDVVNYKVRVTFDPSSVPVKVGMSANASITVQTREGVIQVPNRAITTTGPVKSVQVMYNRDGKQTPVTVTVRTGLTNGQMTEIMGCLDTGNQCLREGDIVAMNLPAATNGQGAFPGGGVIQFNGSGPPPDKDGNSMIVTMPAPGPK